MNSGSKSQETNQQLIKANAEKIAALEASKAQVSDDLKSILDHVLMFNGGVMPNPTPALPSMASELDVFYKVLTEACSPPNGKEADTGIPVYSTSSDEVLAAFNFSKNVTENDSAYEDLPTAAPVKLLEGDTYKRISERPELMSSILLEPANKRLLLSFFHGFSPLKKVSCSVVEEELRGWSAKLPSEIADQSSQLTAVYLKTSRSLSPKDFTDLNGMQALTKTLRRFLKAEAERDDPLTAVGGSISTIVNYVLDIDDPLEEDEEDAPPPRPSSRQRQVREAFQEKILESAANPEEPHGSSSSWLHRVAGFQEFPGALINPPHFGHTSQMTRLENANQSLERASQESFASATGTGPTPITLNQRTGTPLSGFPVYDSQTCMFTNSDGTRASFTLFAATGSSHRSIYPTFDYRDIGRNIGSSSSLAGEGPTTVTAKNLAQRVPAPAEQVPLQAELLTKEIKLDKPTVLNAMLRSWEEIPPSQVDHAEIQASTAKEVATESPKAPLEPLVTPVPPNEIVKPTPDAVIETVISTSDPAPETVKPTPVLPAEPKSKASKRADSKSKLERSRSPSTSQKALNSSDSKTVISKSQLSKLKLSRSKTSHAILKPVATTAPDSPRQVVTNTRTASVIPVLRGRPPMKPKAKKVIDPGVSYREQNKENVELMQARCTTAPSFPTTDKCEMDVVAESKSRPGTANLPAGYYASGKDTNANEVANQSLLSKKSSTVTEFLTVAKNRLLRVISREACDEVREETLDDQKFPSHLYIPSQIEFPFAPSKIDRPKSPKPSETNVRIQSPGSSRPASKTPSKSNAAEINPLTKKPSSKLLTYAEMRKRKLENDTQKAGIPTNRLGIPVVPVPAARPKSQIPLKTALKPRTESRLPTPAAKTVVVQAPPVSSANAKPTRLMTPQRQSRSRGSGY